MQSNHIAFSNFLLKGWDTIGKTNWSSRLVIYKQQHFFDKISYAYTSYKYLSKVERQYEVESNTVPKT